MEKRIWAKSTNGPDVTDVETLMRAISALHDTSVQFQCSPIGIGSSGGVRISAVATFTLLPGSDLPATVEQSANWPSNAGLDFWACLFQLLYQLDFQISERYAQEKLFP